MIQRVFQVFHLEWLSPHIDLFRIFQISISAPLLVLVKATVDIKPRSSS